MGRFAVSDLRALLALPSPNRVERDRVAAACRHVGVLAPDVREALLARDLPVPVARPGDPLLLAATRDEGSLWRFAADLEPGDDARAAWRLAGRVAARTLPVLGDPGAIAETPAPRVSRLCPGSRLLAVDGASFGLAFVLAHVSRAVGVPIAHDVAATAIVDPEGRLRPVDRLDRKLDALRRWAPGVRRVLVAWDQPGDAPELARARDVDEAVRLAFAEEDLDAAPARRWAADPAAADEAARAFLRLVLGKPPTAVRWRAVARGADLLARVRPSWEAHVARAIASRHAGTPMPLPPTPPDRRLRRPHRVALLAHRVQAHHDDASEGWEATLAEARAAVAPEGDEHPEDLELLGAMGRLYAGWGRWAEAETLLARAIAGWFDLDRAPEASFAICERARVAGLRGDAAALGAAAADASRCAGDPRTSDPARGFLQLALGRAYAILGDVDAARVALADAAAPWPEAYVHLRASRLRWLARLGHDVLAELGALAGARDEARFAAVLARADAGEATALAELEPDDLRLFERGRRLEPDAGLRRHLDLFPY
ncbi:MAG: hypothetical protein ACOZNI_08660 [Myxococcota bacterium]